MFRNTSIYRAAIVVIGLTVAATAISSAAVTVDNVSLKKQGEFTELTIYASGAVEFKHQIVEPGAGKPYRVVVDLEGAVHGLPHYNFNDLPSETVTSIRTSQFSVRPDVVRVVLDVKGKVTYKVRRENEGITLVIATPDDAEFPFWCAQPLSETEKIELALGTASKPASDKPEPEKAKAASKPAIEQPEAEPVKPVLVSSSISGGRGDAPKISVPVKRAGEEPSSKGERQALANAGTGDLAETAETGESSKERSTDHQKPQHERSKLATAILSNLPEPEVESQVSGPTAAVVAASQGQSVEPKESEEVTADPSAGSSPAAWEAGPFALTGEVISAGAGESRPPLLVTNDEGKPPQEGEKAESIPQPKIISDNKKDVPAKGVNDSAVLPGVSEPVMDRTLDSSSREAKPEMPKVSPPKREGTSDEDTYRENPDRPTRTSGTLADRFPKRKVIEYQSWGRRDPFAQLVDKSFSGYESGEIPNVENLRLVGVLRSNEGSSALLEDFEGYGYILKDGDPVLNGYVVQIGDDKIIFQIKEYGWSRTIALRLETD